MINTRINKQNEKVKQILLQPTFEVQLEFCGQHTDHTNRKGRVQTFFIQ